MNARHHRLVASASFLSIIFLWAPLVVVAINSFNKSSILASWDGFTGRWYAEALRSGDVRAGVRSTMVIAIFTTGISLTLAISAALWWRKASPRARRAYELVVYLRVIIPEIVFAMALFLLFARTGFPLGTMAVVIGHTVWNSAFATLIMQARVVSLDPLLEDAAADLGASPWDVFRRVTLPGLLPGVVAAGLLAFTFSFDDVVTSVYLSGPNVTPLPVLVLSMIRFRLSPQINAIGLMVMVFTVFTLAASFLLVSRLGGWRREAATIGGG